MEHVLHVFLDQVIVDAGGQGDIESTVRRFVRIGLTPDAETGVVAGPAIRQLLDASHRSARVRATCLAVLGEARDRLLGGISAGQEASLLRDDVPADDLAGLLLVLALGARTAEEFGIELDVASARDAVLRMLQPKS
jgi:hypothetical protein